MNTGHGRFIDGTGLRAEEAEEKIARTRAEEQWPRSGEEADEDDTEEQKGRSSRSHWAKGRGERVKATAMKGLD